MSACMWGCAIMCMMCMCMPVHVYVYVFVCVCVSLCVRICVHLQDKFSTFPFPIHIFMRHQ